MAYARRSRGSAALLLLLASSPVSPSGEGLVLDHVSVVDGLGHPALPDRTIDIQDG